ncbi:MAG: phenylalanine--tRNA ligase subunit beta [Christensenellales bacterium]
MITDQTNATGIAGVMGGEESEITEGTTTVLFEIAAFDRTNIRLTTRALGLRTEASGRFERGVCAATCREAADRACQFVNLLNAGEVIDDVYDCYPAPKAEQTVVASVSRINARSAWKPRREMARILNQPSFKATLDGDTLRAVVPDFREDIEGEADLSEEVLRIYGYEHIKSTMLRGETSTGTRNVHMQLADRVGRILPPGFTKSATSFVSPKLIEKLGLGADDPRCNQLKLMNPLGEDTSVMRSTLVPSMLGTVSLNQNRNNETAMLYEIAPVFDVSARKPGDLPHEQPSLCIGAYGDGVDFYLIRDIVIDMLSQFGVQARRSFRAQSCTIIRVARCRLMAGDRCIATVAELHPNVMQAFEITRRTIIAEVNLEMLCELHTKVGHVRALPKFPAVTRDIALVMEEGTTVGSVLDVIRKTGGALLEKAEMFDIYRGAQLLSGKKSVAFSLTFRNAERTLSDDDVNPLMQKILAACEAECSATLRL